jgi:hypothetical protein
MNAVAVTRSSSMALATLRAVDVLVVSGLVVVRDGLTTGGGLSVRVLPGRGLEPPRVAVVRGRSTAWYLIASTGCAP